MPKLPRLLVVVPAVLPFLLISVGCGNSAPIEIRVVSLFLGNLAEGRGCPPLEFSNNSVACYEGLYQTRNQVVLADVILVDRKTGCILSSKVPPSWNWGYHYRFERLGSNHEGVWIYEGRSNFTFIVKDRHVVRFCPGRVLPNEDVPPCTCTPIPTARMERRLKRHREGQGTGKISTSKSSAHSRKAVGGSSLAPGFRDTPPPTSEPR